MTIDALAERLTPFEDGQLRRLFFFESTGAALSPAMRVLKAELRARDRRTVVRDPELTVTRVPHYA
jgi:hypothetical protein